jgi:hypothetical protein
MTVTMKMALQETINDCEKAVVLLEELEPVSPRGVETWWRSICLSSFHFILMKSFLLPD